MPNKPLFFVVHLDLADDHPVKSPTAKYEVQLLNKIGQAIACGYVGDGETVLRILEYDVPFAVIEAARRQPIGKGDYVDEEGRTANPFDL